VTAATALLLFVTLQRLGELALARRNTADLIARGAFEAAQEHYSLIVILHAAWLGGLWLLAWDAPVHLGWLLAYAVLQGLRIWVLASLGRRWTTRILVVPGETLVRRGPYRLVSHPNYWVVAGEIAVLPLALGMPLYALVFSVLNAAMLFIRIRAENAALSASGHAGGGATAVPAPEAIRGGRDVGG
jgi:methyltransferase